MGDCSDKRGFARARRLRAQGSLGPAAEREADSEAQAASKPSVFNPSYGADAPPTAPKGNKRPFALDPLLGPDR